MTFDLVVVGGGPAGLCFVRSLAGTGLRIALVERQDERVLEAPPDDGREIAVTHHSRALLESLGIWSCLAADEIGLLRDAKVLDGDDHAGLMFRHEEAGTGELGWLLSNHAIRRAAWAEVAALDEVQCFTGVGVSATRRNNDGVVVELDDGRSLQAGLLVAADSRFSVRRREAGITADMHDFGKTMLVCRVRHEVSHRHVAWEWFGYGQTLALLPLHDEHVSSVVLTLAPRAMDALLAGDDADLGRDLAARFRQRLGEMRVIGPRCAYPLVGVYARQFVADRFALIGDAAVGMHPVTAHGFNFGLLGQETLAQQMRAALAAGQPVWEPEFLRRYQRIHRRATWPLYRTTQALATLYTDERAPARALRKLALGAARRLSPFRRLVVRKLAHRRQPHAASGADRAGWTSSTT